MKKEIYMCDICNSEVEKEKLLKVNLPFETSIDTNVSLISYKPSGECSAIALEICNDCAMRLASKISDVVKIEDIPYVGIKVENIDER